MDYQEAIEVIKHNFPPSDRTMLCKALNLAIKALNIMIVVEENLHKELLL